MSTNLEIVISVQIVVGASFTLIGSLGMVKLPNLMTRLHAPTKATTLGVGGLLLASMIYFYAIKGTLSIHEILITLFLFLTAPITAHFLAKAYLHCHVNPVTDLPATGTKSGWCTFDPLPEHPIVPDQGIDS
jgi:multicomponent K+:H+ antiporter subunit G